MTIRVYNTLSRTKEVFTPVVPGKVGMYLCGPTVYKPSHIGHMVGPVIFDVVKRYLVYSGYDVTWVVNITDVDDKLIAEAQRRGLTMAAVAEEMTADYMSNLEVMGVDTIDHFPKATDHIDEIIRFTQELLEKGFAYVAANGDVYFDVGRDEQYGKLSGRSPDEMQGSGGDMASFKRTPLDFALWKSAKPGEPAWPSPWGPGRPGWHIECSAMSRKILGKTFDIHGGGLDLAFPHHENEIAQSECCHSAPQANYWLHNGLMQAADEAGKVGGRSRSAQAANASAPAGDAQAGDIESQMSKKISKSTGAGPFKELLKVHPPETVRFFLVSTHYRSPITYSDDLVRETGQAIEAFYRYFQRYERVTGESFYAIPAPQTREAGQFDPAGDSMLTSVSEIRTQFQHLMDDDFNTGGAIGELNRLVRLLNRYIDTEGLEKQIGVSETKLAHLRTATLALRELTSVLGVFLKPVAPRSSGGDDVLIGKLMELLIRLRADLRKAKSFALADQIRNTLIELGITLEDHPTGTTWSLKKDAPPPKAEQVAAVVKA